MTTRATFLNTPYGAYNHRDVPKEDEELTHVGPDTPCGEYLRRFWHPVATEEELGDLPLAVRMMGEDLVLFRDKAGRVGLLELHCGASLEYGQIEEAGIRCCYHGWMFDVAGRILDTPNEPPESTFKERLCHGAYPTMNFNGVIFTYMGPPEVQPEFPLYDAYTQHGFTRWHTKRDRWPCNWLQVKDNSMDPSHTAFLHVIEMGHGFGEIFKEWGTIDWIETPIGSAYIHSRRNGDNVFVRMVDFICPTMHRVPTGSEDGTKIHGFSPATSIAWLVPIDDTHCTTLTMQGYHEGQEINREPGFGQDGDRPYEERQRVPGDWDAQVTQRPIAVHSMERLGAADRGIILLRRQIGEGIHAVQSGQDPKGVVRTPGQIIPTYGNNTVLEVPPSATPQEERSLLLSTGRRVAEGYLKDPSTRGV